jgi:hypothetical protein
MLSMGMQGEAMYKGFPVMDEGAEYWWVQLHLYKNKEDDHKKMGLWMFTNSEMYSSFLDSARCASWSAIKELGERLKWRLHNTQQDLKEEKEDTTTLKETINQLQGDMEKLVSELSVQGDLIKTKDEQIARNSWTRTMDLYEREPRSLVGLPFSNFNKRRHVINVMVIPTCG